MPSFSLLVNWSGAFLCFLPIFLNWKLDISGCDSEQDIPLRHSASSKSFEFSLVASIAVSAPLICEQAIDSILTIVNKSGSRYTYESVVLLKWILLITLLIPNLALLCIVSPSENYIYIPIIFTSRQIILFHILFSFLGTYGAPIWNPRITSLCSMFFSSGQILECFSAFTVTSVTLNQIKFVLYILCSILFFWTLFRWFIHLKSHLNLKLEGLTMDEYYCNVHLLALAICGGGLWGMVIMFSSATWAEATAPSLYMYAYIEISYTVLLAVWNGRLARREMAHTKTELETKRMFVRYVSHEIRTPLNTVTMGLQLLRTELSKIRGNEMLLDIVQDLSVSCDTAVDILNDLLMYEKLTANILQLDSAVISVKKFVSEVVRPFFMQARQAGVLLRIEFSDDLLDESVDVNIFGDKSKLSQVVRNLLSNALKFTKRNGQVVVSISCYTEDTPSRRFPTIGLDLPQYICGFWKASKSTLKPRPIVLSSTSSKRIHISDSISHRNLNPQFREADSISGIAMSGIHFTRKIDRYKTPDDLNDSRKKMHVLKIAVSDSGVGISEENQKRLFKEIVQFNPGELQDGKGSGLGLWISSRIMGLHGGDLTVLSEGVGSGCTFTLSTPITEIVILPQLEHKSSDVPIHELDEIVEAVPNLRGAVDTPDLHRLPLAQIESPSHQASDSVSAINSLGADVAFSQGSLAVDSSCGELTPSNGEGNRGRHSHILLVDDAPMNRKMLRRLLNDRSGTISEAEDGKQALDMVLATLRDPSLISIDVVIIDFQMPVMDGPTAVREMRSAGYRGIVIGLTGNALPSDIQLYLSQGADRVMIKPCHIEELDRILTELTKST